MTRYLVNPQHSSIWNTVVGLRCSNCQSATKLVYSIVSCLISNCSEAEVCSLSQFLGAGNGILEVIQDALEVFQEEVEIVTRAIEIVKNVLHCLRGSGMAVGFLKSLVARGVREKLGRFSRHDSAPISRLAT